MKRTAQAISITIMVLLLSLLSGCFKKDYNKLLNKINLTYGDNKNHNEIVKDFDLVSEVDDNKINWVSDSESAKISDNKVTITRMLEDVKVNLTASFIDDEDKKEKVFTITIKADDSVDSNFGITYGTNAGNEWIREDFQLLSEYMGIPIIYTSSNGENFSISNDLLVRIKREEDDIKLFLTASITIASRKVEYKIPITILGTKPITTFFVDIDGKVISQNEIEKGDHPSKPFMNNASLKFEYFSDKELKNQFDFSQLIKDNTKIYVKSVMPDKNIVILSRNRIELKDLEEVTSYQLYYDASLIKSQAESVIDLNKLPQDIGEDVTVTIKATINDKEVIIFTESANVWTQPKKVGFEKSEGFTVSQSYKNIKPALSGNESYEWEIVYGTPSVNDAISGGSSLQMRTYEGEHVTPYAMTAFSIDGLREISFFAKTDKANKLKLSYSYDGESFIDGKIFELTKKAVEYKYAINEERPVYVKFSVLKNEASPVAKVTIDEVTFIRNADKILILNIQDNISSDLQEIKARFENDRANTKELSNLKPYSDLEYYAALNNLTGTEFKEKLSSIITDTMTARTYGEARFILEVSDLERNRNNSYLYGAYDNAEITVRYWDAGKSWAREHVWPNSRLGIPRVGNGDRNQGTDLYNLRAIVPSTNSSRSNRYFDIPESGTENQTVGNNAYYTGDDQRGDTARILFYMATRYPKILSLVNDDLTNDSKTNYKPSGAKMSKIDTLLRWHKEDPVSNFEIKRNEAIYKYQGNRNPYVDHPEYVEKYFYEEIEKNKAIKDIYQATIYQQLDMYQAVVIPNNRFII